MTMFRNVQRATRAIPRALLISPKNAAAHSLSFRISRPTIPRAQITAVQRSLSCFRSYTTANNDTSDKSGPSKDPKDLDWLHFLESASEAPWLTKTPPDAEDRLRRAYSLLFQVILYLGRPLSKDVKEVAEATQQFLLAFNSAPVTADSDIGRARHAIAILTKQIKTDIASVPPSSDLRSRHTQIFALADALGPLCDVHLEGVRQNKAPDNGEVVDEGAKWQDFWTKAQPIVLALGEELDKEGYGIPEELVKEAKAEQERKEKHDAGPGGEERK